MNTWRSLEIVKYWLNITLFADPHASTYFLFVVILSFHRHIIQVDAASHYNFTCFFQFRSGLRFNLSEGYLSRFNLYVCLVYLN